MTVIAVLVYASACVLANLIVFALGPWVSPFNSFFLIGLDLALRDFLHMRLSRVQMAMLILASGGITWLLNPAAGIIAVASATAFTASALIDWTVFAKVTGTWLKRSNFSNVAGAAVDSLLFPTIAFGTFLPHIIGLQFIAKVAGGGLWSLVLRRQMEKAYA